MVAKPRMDPLHWDAGAAHAAASALRRAAGRLRDSAQMRRAWAAQAQATWEGVHRRTFDQDLYQMLQQAERLANDYDAKANEILSRSNAAEAAERERQAAVRRWEDEQRRKREAAKRRRS